VLAQTFILLKDIVDLIKNSDLVRFLGVIGTGLGKVSDAIGKGVDAYKKAKKGYEEAIGMGGKPVVAPDRPVVPRPNTLIDEVFSKLTVSLTSFSKELTNINKIIADGVVVGIKNVSRAIAESIVLGKKLTDSFRELAQRVLVNIIEKLIEEQLIRLSLFALEKLRKALEEDKTREMQKQNSLLQSQLILENGIAGARAAQAQYGGGGGGGGFDLGTLFNIGSSIFGFAEGGAVKGGMPITVGERGREVFVPNTDGTIVPNQDLGAGNNYNFTIVATDVRGVKELLLNNRSTIVNIMNQALNAKGKSSLV
jgi:hypothetical protein